MTKDYKQLWKRITDKTGQSEVAQAAHALAEIVADSAGRDFISRSSREDAELCVEILDHVSRDLHSPPPATSDGLIRASPNSTSNPLRRVLSLSR